MARAGADINADFRVSKEVWVAIDQLKGTLYKVRDDNGMVMADF